MKSAFKNLILYCLTVAILVLFVSCEWNLNRYDLLTKEETDATSENAEVQIDTPTSAEQETSIPQETVSSEMIPETTTEEPIVPQETLPEEQITTPEPFETTTENIIPEGSTSSEESVSSEEITIPQETTTPQEITNSQETTSWEETTTPELPHVHILINGQCVCGYAIVLETESLFDNDKDGDVDMFYFSSVLPERFTSKNAIHFGADEYDSGLSSWVGISYEGADTYYFCRNDRKSYIVYEVEVAKAGVYEMAICQRMEDTEVYGAKFTVNEDSDEKYTYATSYQFANEQDMTEVCKNTSTMNSYMFGIKLKLVAGVNYIKIELAPGIESGQYFRDFYLVKTSK